MTDLTPGEMVWVSPDMTVGREHAGRRPAIVVCGADYLAIVNTLAIVVPVTGVDRGWPNHIPVDGVSLPKPSWAMTEQVRIITRVRVSGTLGRVTDQTLTEIRMWIRDFLDL